MQRKEEVANLSAESYDDTNESAGRISTRKAVFVCDYS